jgi:hypothetical protein
LVNSEHYTHFHTAAKAAKMGWQGMQREADVSIRLPGSGATTSARPATPGTAGQPGAHGDPARDLGDDLASLAPGAPAAGGSPLRLFRFERRWLTLVFETMLPSGAHPGMPLGGRDVPLGRFVDHLADSLPLTALVGARAGLWMVMVAPLFFRRTLRPFSRLPFGEREALLERLRRSDMYLVREAVTFLKVLACLGFCGLGPVQRRLGIHPTDATAPAWTRRPR